MNEKNKFACDCKVIELKYEYRGYTGSEKYGLITTLSEEELRHKYGSLLEEYEPFILLDNAFLEVRKEYVRNEKKFEWRSRTGHNFDIDEEFDQHHPECAMSDCAEEVLANERNANLKTAIQRLTPIQQRRLSRYFFDEKTYREIAAEEGVNISIVHRTIEAALKNLKKFLD